MKDLITPQHYFRSRAAKPRKRFGQHFLTQTSTAERMVQNAQLQASDVVVEIGPGLGALTQFIAPCVRRLHLIELDRDLAAYLETRSFPPHCQVRIHQQDVMTFDFRSLSRSEGQRLVIMGNLPYSISSPLFFRLLESASSIRKAVFMIQKEVGERLTAQPGTKDYGVLSVLLKTYTHVSPLFIVGPGQFYPPPKVDSIVVCLDFLEKPILDAFSFDFLRKMVNKAFQQRRKTLYNSLRSLVGKQTGSLDEAFTVSGIDPKRRPETLSFEEFVQIGKALQQSKVESDRSETKRSGGYRNNDDQSI